METHNPNDGAFREGEPPFRPPRPVPHDEPSAGDLGLSIAAVITGLLTHVGCSFVFNRVYSFVLENLLLAQGVPPNEINPRLGQMQWVTITNMIVGHFGVTVLAGFVTGRTAKRAEILHGGLAGLAIVLNQLFYIGSAPTYYIVFGIIPLALLGGFLARARRDPLAGR